MRTNKIIATALSAALAASLLAGCGGNTTSSSAASDSAAADSTAADSAAADSTAEAAWPTAAVQFSVPAKAGGVTDIYARYVQNSLQQNWGGTFSTVNYDTPAVAYQTVVAATDPNTLLFQHSSLVCNYVTGSLQFDPTTDYRVVGMVADLGAQAFITNPDAPYDTWEEMIEYAKANPGDVSGAIATNGTTHFIFGMLQSACGVELNLVECSSEADKLTNVAGGIINLANCSLNNALQYEEAGQIKVLGILNDGSRDSYADLGYEWPVITDVTWAAHMYVFANASISDEEAQAINDALCSIAQDPEYIEECITMGGTATAYTLEEAQADFDATTETCIQVAQDLGIYGL